jgi:hypothetical protein
MSILAASLAAIGAALAGACLAGLAERLGLDVSGRGLRRRAERVIDRLCRMRVTRSENAGGSWAESWRDDDLIVITRQLIIGDAEPSAIRAALDLECEQLIGRRRVNRTVCVMGAMMFPIVGGLSALAHVHAVATSPVLSGVIVSAVIGYLLIAGMCAIRLLAGSGGSQGEAGVYMETEMLALGAELIVRGVGEGELRSRLSAYVAQPEQSAGEPAPLRKAA